MFERISFYIGNTMIEINGYRFPLGELTTEILNLPKDIYAELRHTLEAAEEHLTTYLRSRDVAEWFAANEKMILLDQRMMRYRIFRLVKQESSILAETRLFTQQYSLFPEKDCDLTEDDLDLLSEISQYEEYLKDPDAFGVDREIPSEPPPLTRALLIYPGNLKRKLDYYKHTFDKYASALYDVESFNNTIMNFIRFYLSDVEQMNRNMYVAALMEFFENPRREKLIANPVSGTELYTSVDPVMLRHVPRETEEGSGEFKIYEYYEAELLQTLLKMDFYRALEAGRVIRRCEFCGRYFLLTKGYHTKYCDQPNPGNPRYTCAQLGYHLKGVKEAAGDDPKAQALRRCKMRIDKDYSRANIDDEQRDKLLRKARDLFHAAHTAPGVSNEEFERQLASRNLYALCNVERYTNKRGRPKAK